MLQDKKRAVVLDPNDAEARFAYGEALYVEGNLDAAVAQLEKALDLKTEHANARRLLARAYLAQDRMTLAENLLRPAVDREDVDACDALADLYLRMDRADDALLSLEVAVRNDPNLLDRRIRAASLALDIHLLARAAEHVTAATRLAPNDVRVRSLVQELAQRMGDVVGATESPLARGRDFLVGRALETTNRAGVRDLAPIVEALRRADLSAAKRAFVTIAPNVKAMPITLFIRGEIALASGENELATRAFRDAAAGGDVAIAVRAHRRLGEIAAFGADHLAARNAFTQSIALAEHDSADGKVASLEGLGDALHALHDDAAAEDAYRRAAQIEPMSGAAAKLAALRARRKHGVARASNVGRIGALGWSARGGLVSPIEAVCVPGRGELLFTGNVGALGREAAQVAASCVKARAAHFGLAERIASTDLHIHFTDMTIAKDGASAGLALALAATSAYKDVELLPDLAATGEITIQGAVKAVAGLHEKLVGACLYGIRTVLVPRRCVIDLEKLPKEVRRRVVIQSVDSLPEAIDIAFGVPPSLKAP